MKLQTQYARPEKSSAAAARQSSIGIRKYPARRIPRFDPSAFFTASPSAMPTSSTVWCWSTSRSPRADEIEIEAAVARDLLEHVIEESNAGGDLRLAAPVEIQPQANVGFFRGSLRSPLFS